MGGGPSGKRCQGRGEKEKRTKRIPPPKVRGVFFRLNPKGQVKDHIGRMGDWWIRWTDTPGKEHREKCRSRPAALDLYGERRAEVRTGHHFPETMPRVRGTTLQGVCTDYADTLKANGRDSQGQVKTRLAEVVDNLGNIAAKHLTPQDVEKLKARLLATPARGRKDPKDPKKERPRTPASVSRYLQDLRAAYNLARRNGKVDKNPVVDMKLLRENNKRVRGDDGRRRNGRPDGSGSRAAAVSHRLAPSGAVPGGDWPAGRGSLQPARA